MKVFDINRFNSILRDFNQSTQAIKITGKEIVLSNGVVLNTEKDVRLCKKRVMKGADCWKIYFDIIYGTDKDNSKEREKFCRSITSTQGGINCQQKHKNTIKKNLNNGIPWNKNKKTNKPAWNKGLTKDTDSRIQNLSESRIGNKNPMFGKKMSDENKSIKSKVMKEKILKGEFTPNSNNRNTHWDSFFKNKKYRSSWEALYQCFDPTAEYETFRLQYNYNNKEHVYILDFINYTTKQIIEVKPKEMLNDKKTLAKIDAAKKWCVDNNFTFILADKDFFKKIKIPVDLLQFDEKTQKKIRKFYEIS